MYSRKFVLHPQDDLAFVDDCQVNHSTRSGEVVLRFECTNRATRINSHTHAPSQLHENMEWVKYRPSSQVCLFVDSGYQGR